MKHKLSDLIAKSGNGITLSEAEKAKMQHVLSEYMAIKPVRAGVGSRLATAEGFTFANAYHFTRKSMAIALVLALLISGGATSYAAEGALPGDTLYPVKVSVNEEVRTALAVSTEAKAEWETEKAERRLEEATALAAEGKLTPALSSEIAARFEAHADKATEDFSELESEDEATAVGIATNFEAALSAHEEILNELEKDGKTLTASVRAKARSFASIRTRAEGTLAIAVPEVANAKVEVMSMTMLAPEPANTRMAAGDTTLAGGVDAEVTAHVALAERMHNQAQVKLKETTALYERSKRRLSTSNQTRIQAEIKLAGQMITEGEGMFAADNFGGAYRNYHEAFVKLEKLSVYLKTAARLKIDFDFYSRPGVQIDDPTNVPPSRGSSTGGGTSGGVRVDGEFHGQSRDESTDDRGGDASGRSDDHELETEVEVEVEHGSVQVDNKIRINVGI